MSDYFWYFIIYSFLGFLLEVLFARLTHDPKRDRKCFYLLPLCPVYGLGALLILRLTALTGNRWLLLPGICILSATAVEYGTGEFYRRVLKVSFWDYSKLRLNLNGQVCLYFSLAWGVLGFLFIWGIHPLIAPLAAAIPNAVTLPALFLFLSDAGLTAYLLRRFQTTEILMWYAERPLPKRIKSILHLSKQDYTPAPGRATGGSTTPEPIRKAQ